MNAVTRYEPDEQFDLVAEITRKPDADPVADYLATLKSAASVSTMEQALGVVVSLLAGAGRPDNGAQQPRAQRKEVAQQMKQAAHDFDWFKFDGKQAKALAAALTAENYAKSSQEKMVAAVMGTLREVESINTQELIDVQERLDTAPMTMDEKFKTNQLIDMYFGRRALITQSAIVALKKFEPKAPQAQKATSLYQDNEVTSAQPQRRRRKNTIDRSTKGTSKHRQLTKRELNRLWAVCTQDGAKGARDMAIIALGFGCGLRRSEIAALKFEDIDWNGKVSGQEGDEESRQLPLDDAGEDTDGVGYLPITIQHGKGDKRRVIAASNGSRQALLQWRKVRGDDPGPLLVSFDRWAGLQLGKGIDSQVIYTVCDELATRAKVEKFSPHDMRRSFISGFLDASGDLSMAASLAGHSSVTTTQIYDRRGDATKAKATIKHVHIPFEPVTVQEKLDGDE